VVAVLMLASKSQSRIPSTPCACALAHSRVAYTSDYYMYSEFGPAATMAEDFANGAGPNRCGLLLPSGYFQVWWIRILQSSSCSS
jgi:hypothetical protein